MKFIQLFFDLNLIKSSKFVQQGDPVKITLYLWGYFLYPKLTSEIHLTLFRRVLSIKKSSFYCSRKESVSAGMVFAEFFGISRKENTV
jgi:hypothetical protein